MGKGMDIGRCNFDQRMQCIEKEIIAPRRERMKDGRIDRGSETMGVRLKSFWCVYQLIMLIG